MILPFVILFVKQMWSWEKIEVVQFLAKDSNIR